MRDSSRDNYLLQICRRTNQQCKQVPSGDLAQITAILQQNYRYIQQVLPDVSYTQFKYTLAQINGRVTERD